MSKAQVAEVAQAAQVLGPTGKEWTLPQAWTQVDFISDLHLTPNVPLTFSGLRHYLQSTQADAIIILGDLFETWIGDDSRHSGFEAECTELINQASQHRLIAFMAGNRDFLLGSAMAQAAGLQLLPDPTVISAWAQRALLTHGDAWCLGDHAYQRFRQLVRSAQWQHNFLSQPLEIRRAQAQRIREESRRHQKNQDPKDWVDLDLDTAIHGLNATQSSTLIHGHTHRPGTQALGPGLTRHVLSDWDLDDGLNPRAEVLTWSADGWHRHPLRAAPPCQR